MFFKEVSQTHQRGEAVRSGVEFCHFIISWSLIVSFINNDDDDDNNNVELVIV